MSTFSDLLMKVAFLKGTPNAKPTILAAIDGKVVTMYEVEVEGKDPSTASLKYFKEVRKGDKRRTTHFLTAGQSYREIDSKHLSSIQELEAQQAKDFSDFVRAQSNAMADLIDSL